MKEIWIIASLGGMVIARFGVPFVLTFLLGKLISNERLSG